MTEYEYKTNKVLSYAWLIVAIAAILGAFIKEAWHHLFIAAIAVVMYFSMRPKKWVHIPDDVYARLNDQIDFIQQDMEDEVKRTSIDAETDGACVTMEIELRAKSSKSKFRDEAWGYSKIFTEISSLCEIEILDTTVTDENGRTINSDFNEDRIELSYEYTEWK